MSLAGHPRLAAVLGAALCAAAALGCATQHGAADGTRTMPLAGDQSPSSDWILKFADGADLAWDDQGRFNGAGTVSQVDSVRILLEDAGAASRPLFPHVLPAYTDSGVAFPDTARSRGDRLRVRLPRYIHVRLPAGTDVDSLSRALIALGVEAFYPRPVIIPASDCDGSPDGPLEQGYLKPASSHGVDAELAWTMPGGDGDAVDVLVADCNYYPGHRDLRVEIHVDPDIADDFMPDGQWHGLGILGVLAASRESQYVQGIVPAARYHFAHLADACLAIPPPADVEFPFPDDSELPFAATYRHATQCLGPGDVAIMPLVHLASGIQLPINASLAYRDALMDLALNHSIAVVIAAGNDSRSLNCIALSSTNCVANDCDVPEEDDACEDSETGWRFPWRLAWSDASDPGYDDQTIIVSAGNPDDQGLAGDAHGDRVDCQSWGENVATLDRLTLETDCWLATFNGTSAATAIIGGVVTCLQGALQGSGRAPLSPNELRQFLRRDDLGLPQACYDDLGQLRACDQDDPRIGPQPDLARLLGEFGLVQPYLYVRDSPLDPADDCSRRSEEFRTPDLVLAEQALRAVAVVVQPFAPGASPEFLAPRSGWARSACLRALNLGAEPASGTAHLYRAAPSPLPVPASWVHVGSMPLTEADPGMTSFGNPMLVFPAVGDEPSPFDTPAGDGGPWHSWIVLVEQPGRMPGPDELISLEFDLAGFMAGESSLRFRNSEQAWLRQRAGAGNYVSESLPLRIHGLETGGRALDLGLIHDLPAGARLEVRSGDFTLSIDPQSGSAEATAVGAWPPPLAGELDLSTAGEIWLRSLTVNGGDHADIFLRVEIPGGPEPLKHRLRIDLVLEDRARPVRIGRFTYELVPRPGPEV